MSAIQPDLTSDDKALKVLTKSLVEACGGPVAVAEVLGLSQGLISAYGSMSEPKRFMPLSHVARLEGLCGRAIVSSWMVRRLGAPESPAALTLDDVSRLSREGSDVLAAVIGAMADGHVSSAERAVIRREADELIVVATSIRDKAGQP